MKRWLLLVGIVGLSGCTNLHYGNFSPASASAAEGMAKDTAQQLIRLYPPAKNRFCIGQAVQDGFGHQLLELMRKKGYGVNETGCIGQGSRFLYVVDTPRQGLYRVTIFIGSQSLSRVYSLKNSVLVPVSVWSHKE